jgi:hypothetical protein
MLQHAEMTSAGSIAVSLSEDSGACEICPIRSAADIYDVSLGLFRT